VITKHLIIKGHVQGVSYRAWLQNEAKSLDIDGWVRNRSDGSVEALIHGPEDCIQKLIEQAHEGPFLAKVATIISTDGRFDGSTSFDIRPSI
jgi:acylphosphatase